MIGGSGLLPRIGTWALLSLGAALAGLILLFSDILVLESGNLEPRTAHILTTGIGICSLFGLICSLKALALHRQLGGSMGGGRLGTAGLILSLICLAGFGISTQFNRFAAWKDRGEREICAANLRLLHRAMELYAAGHDGNLPEVSNWCGAVLDQVDTLRRMPEYRGNVFQCPTSRSKHSSYGFNEHLGGRKLEHAQKNAILFFEISGGWNVAGDPHLLSTSFHRGPPQVILVDGSVRSLGAR